MSLFLLAAVGAQAQGNFPRARIRSFKGVASIHTVSGDITPKINYNLEPGNKIVTGWNGQVVISLNDGGSQITVLPKSTVILKNFRAAQLARELLDIVMGRVMVKIHHYGKKPNPYRLNSPAASIAVRGTEFIVDVRLGGETLVLVREGLVEVWSHNNPGNTRLVTPGNRVIVRPGGDISSAFPGPGSGLNGRTRYIDMGEDYKRSVDSVAQNSNEISPVFFSAFPDQHLDCLENPAYASDFKSAEGRLFILPSASQLNRQWEADDTHLDYSMSPQLTFFTPIPGSRLVVGGGVSAFAVRSEKRSDDYFTSIISGLTTNHFTQHSRQAMRFKALNVSFVASYSLGDNGKTSVGIGVETLSGSGNYLNEFTASNTGYYNGNWENAHSRFARTRLTLGLTRRFSSSARLGLYYRHGITSSSQENQHLDEHLDKTATRRSNAEHRNLNISNFSSEIGARFRFALTKRLFYGVEGSYLYERINSIDEMTNSWSEMPQSGGALPNIRGEALSGSLGDISRYLARRARLGMGLGFALTSKTLINFDATGGIFNNDRPPQAPINSSGALFSYSFSPGSLASTQGKFVSAHVAVQTNLWRNLYLSASGLKTVRKDILYIRTYKYKFLFTREDGGPVYGPDGPPIWEPYNAVDKGDLSNFGFGWKFKPNLTAEYVYSKDYNYRNNSHSFRIRYTFNLGIADEK
jgi:hypothetical protein